MCLDSHESPDASESGRGLRDGQSAIVSGHKSAFAIYFPRAILEKDERRVSSPRPSGKKIAANVHENAVSSREWRNVKLNEGGEEGGGEGRRRRRRREERKKTKERSLHLHSSGHIT